MVHELERLPPFCTTRCRSRVRFSRCRMMRLTSRSPGIRPRPSRPAFRDHANQKSCACVKNTGLQPIISCTTSPRGEHHVVVTDTLSSPEPCFELDRRNHILNQVLRQPFTLASLLTTPAPHGPLGHGATSLCMCAAARSEAVVCILNLWVGSQNTFKICRTLKSHKPLEPSDPGVLYQVQSYFRSITREPNVVPCDPLRQCRIQVTGGQTWRKGETPNGSPNHGTPARSALRSTGFVRTPVSPRVWSNPATPGCSAAGLAGSDTGAQ